MAILLRFRLKNVSRNGLRMRNLTPETAIPTIPQFFASRLSLIRDTTLVSMLFRRQRPTLLRSIHVSSRSNMNLSISHQCHSRSSVLLLYQSVRRSIDLSFTNSSGYPIAPYSPISVNLQRVATVSHPDVPSYFSCVPVQLNPDQGRTNGQIDESTDHITSMFIGLV